MSIQSPLDMTSQALTIDERMTSLVSSDNIYVFDIPESLRNVQSTPIIRVNELDNKKQDYADNTVQTYYVAVAVDIWVPKNSFVLVDQIRYAADDIMADNHFKQFDGNLEIDKEVPDLLMCSRWYEAILHV